MIETSIRSQELFPIYTLDTPDPSDDRDHVARLKVSRKQFLRWQKAFQEFSRVQDEIVEELHVQNQGKFVWCNSNPVDGIFYEINEE